MRTKKRKDYSSIRHTCVYSNPAMRNPALLDWGMVYRVLGRRCEKLYSTLAHMTPIVLQLTHHRR